ncbi:MAG: ArnT family glycosyltransferase, partial [bacterium]
MSWWTNRRRAEAAVFAFALVLRLAWVGYLGYRDAGLRGPDAPSYEALATNLLAGKGLQKQDYTGLFTDPQRSLVVRSFRPPLLPVVLAGIYGVAGHRLWVARTAMAVMGAALCLAVMAIVRRVFDERTALVAGLLTAVYPKFVYYAGLLVTETLCTLLLAVAIVLLLAACEAERRRWLWAAAGVALGLGTLARSSLLLFAPVAALWVLIVRPLKRRAVLEATLVVVGFVAVMTPWWVRNVRVHGRFVAATTEGGYTLWVTNNPRATGGGHCFFPREKGEFDGLSEVAIDRRFWRKGLAYIREHPGHFLRLAGAKFVRFWRLWPHAEYVGTEAAVVAGVSFTPVLLLALWGLVRSRRRWRPVLLFVLLFAYYTALHMV